MVSAVLTGFTRCFISECDWFSLIGKLYGLYVTYKVFSKIWVWIKLYFLSPTLKWATDVKSFGKWAVVTGSTDGIGKCYAIQMAEKGMNIVLISRSAERLDNVAKEIAEKCGNRVETKCIVIDFSHDTSIYDKIEQEIEDLDIGVLVNNVGLGYEPDYYKTLPKESLESVITINCFSVAFMTRILISKMVEKKKGLIINIGSVTAHLPCPFASAYAATKAFVYQFTVCMEQEYRSKGITFQCVSPGFVATNMTKILFPKPSFTVPRPDHYVASAIETIGLKFFVYGYFAHELQMTFFHSFCENCRKYLVYKFLSGCRDIGLARKAKKN